MFYFYDRLLFEFIFIIVLKQKSALISALWIELYLPLLIEAQEQATCIKLYA